MKILQKICFVLMLITFPSVHAGSCFGKPGDFDDCLIKAKQGDARAQYALGWIYRGNKDIPNDVT